MSTFGGRKNKANFKRGNYATLHNSNLIKRPSFC